MVDSIKGLGSLPKTLLGKTSADETRSTDSKTETPVAKDKVEISAKALSLQEAERVATETRDSLKKLNVNLSGSRSELIRGDTV